MAKDNTHIRLGDRADDEASGAEAAVL